MNGANFDRKKFIEELIASNQSTYGTPDGRAMLRSFELAFEDSWIYLFELVQNALDAGARRIAFRVKEDGGALIFQHDGGDPLDKEAIVALSKIFQSTKGGSSVGFMGIGFKSVFQRFREVRISGWEWKIRYEINEQRGEKYGDLQPDLLGAVIPIWDDTIATPDSSFTTRFEMRRRVSGSASLEDDLAHFVPDDDNALLAILARSGLEYLDVNGQLWNLNFNDCSDGTQEAFACSDDKSYRWRIFSSRFRPSEQAIARFLEHRRIQDSEYDDSKLRWVSAVLPLNGDGTPAPPDIGRVYATLPTHVTLPFRIHINADWLLSISRTGLKEIELNAWQCEIIDSIADVLANFFDWIGRTFSSPAEAKAAFTVIDRSALEKSDLKDPFVEGRWLSRLVSRIENVAMLPVWTAQTDTLAFARPRDAVLPPRPLAEAFRRQPALRPATLLKGPVVMKEVLGTGACELMEKTGLLSKMSPRYLERTWSDGLEYWWEALAGEQERLPLLFHIWSAVSEITSEGEWREIDLPCVRTIAGKWLPANQVAYFEDPLPFHEEPGGSQVLRFMDPFIPKDRYLPHEWIDELQRGAQCEGDEERYRSTALTWIRYHAEQIHLREVIQDAMNDLISSASPNWSVPASLGHWAKHRNRPDLLTWALVESSGELRCIPIGDALLADPYVESRQGRKHLFPGMPCISAIYLERDPENETASEWRSFFERAGAMGKFKVRKSTKLKDRGECGHVASFLGIDSDEVGESNWDGYRLLDFHIEPDPNLDSLDSLRALSAWIEDGYKDMRETGKRKVEWFFRYGYSRQGAIASAWVTRLSELVWVPCGDGELRRPKDVLSQQDPTREDAPVAQLSAGLLEVLEREGVNFGSGIPETPALRQLLEIGSQLNAGELAHLLLKCREEIETNDDRRLFSDALPGLTIPTVDDQRVSLDRIVKQVGGSRRGFLGGWTVPLDRIDEVLREELLHHDFFQEFPDTTTGGQALAYIRNVWRRAQSTPGRLANEVRDVLPVAYAYCLDDCDRDGSLLRRWQAVASEALVFAGREWIVPTENEIVYFDDINDGRFLPKDMKLIFVTGGHLGNSQNEQLRTIDALGIRRLSSYINMEWNDVGGVSYDAGEWGERFHFILRLLQWIRGDEGEEGKGAKGELTEEIQLRRVDKLTLTINIRGDEYTESVPVNARLQENYRRLTVAGQPIQFGSDAARELVRYFSFGQRGDLAADLTGMLVAIGDQSAFELAVEKFRRAFARGFDLELPVAPCSDGGTNRIPDSRKQTEHGKSAETRGAGTAGVQEESSGRGTYGRDRVISQQNTLAEKLRSLTGELVPDDDVGLGEFQGTDGRFAGNTGDKMYREAAAQYEREQGREPEFGDPYQQGWDIRSVDPKNGAVRLIEVKGRGHPWVDDEVVELSRAQIRKAFETLNSQTEAWYLYVVEETDDGGYQTLPVSNPVGAAGRWILCGKLWRALAEDTP